MDSRNDKNFSKILKIHDEKNVNQQNYLLLFYRRENVERLRNN